MNNATSVVNEILFEMLIQKQMAWFQNFFCNPRGCTYFIPSLGQNNILRTKIRIRFKRNQITSMHSKV